MISQAIQFLFSAVAVAFAAWDWWDDDWNGPWHQKSRPNHHGHLDLFFLDYSIIMGIANTTIPGAAGVGTGARIEGVSLFHFAFKFEELYINYGTLQ